MIGVGTNEKGEARSIRVEQRDVLQRAAIGCGGSRRRRLIAFAAAIVAGPISTSAIARDIVHPDRPSSEWAARNAGILDQQTLGLIEQGSLEPVVLGLRALRRFAENRTEAADEHISFRLPAASFSVVDLEDGPRGSNRLGWTVFSRTLDPVRLDRDADLAACPRDDERCRIIGPPNSGFAERRANGEYILRIEVTSVLFTPEHRQRVLWGKSGMGEHVFLRRGRRCAFRHDELLDMLATEAPPDPVAARACELSGFVGMTTQDGRTFRPANFLKLEPDGSARFVVRCRAYVTAVPGGASAPYCELQGYLGIWPLFLWVPSDRAAEWNETFERARSFLARHTEAHSGGRL